jgi:hypothetical protein
MARQYMASIRMVFKGFEILAEGINIAVRSLIILKLSDRLF